MDTDIYIIYVCMYVYMYVYVFMLQENMYVHKEFFSIIRFYDSSAFIVIELVSKVRICSVGEALGVRPRECVRAGQTLQ